MKLDELDIYFDNRPNLQWNVDDEGNFYIKDVNYNDGVKVTPKAMNEISEAELDKTLTAGRNVDHMTRITGYFSKVSGWNKGKLAELKDRVRGGEI